MPAKKKLVVLALVGLLFWGGVAWLFVTMPIFIIDLLPPLLPLTVFTFLLFLIGLILLTIAATSVVRSLSPRYTWAVILISASIVVLYNLSPLAPAWSCWGKRLYVITVKAGQTCRTICTNNKKKPCGGWSDCWGGKDISCSSAGKDQDGRNCNGCCFSCDVVCEDDDPPPPAYQPPTVSGSVTCSQAGNNGWCIGTSTLSLSSSDPQGFAVTISGMINGSAFSCPAGNSCSIALPEGNGSITFLATASTSGLSSAAGSTVWKRDITAPVVNPTYPSVNGSNGWHITSPIAVSAMGSDAMAGIASAQIAVNGGAWQGNATLTDGIYTIDFQVIDNAGHSTTISRTIKVDATPPTVSPVIPSPDGSNDWFVTAPVNVSANGSDSGSGLATALVSVNGGGWQHDASLSDGVYTINFTSTDDAGNTVTETRIVKVDTVAPSLSTSISGTAGLSVWYISETTTTVSSSDETSGLDRIEYNQNNKGWLNGTSIISNDGVNIIDVRVYDVAGNISSDSLQIKVDTIAPSLSTSITGTMGLSGWYISHTTTTISSNDETSSVERVEYNQNSAGWQNGSSVISNDGINKIDARVYDSAGNMSSESIEIKVDTVRPTSSFISPSNGSNDTLVRGSYSLSGSSSDATSGVSVAEITLDGQTWLPLVISSENAWGYTWDTLSWADGIYPVVVRTTDVAGNQELFTSGANVTLLINNTPPHIKLTPEWLIWQSGSLLIKTEYFPVRDGTIVIFDPKKRWPEVRIPFGQKYPKEIKWDRRFANGVLAPSGNYRVTVSACNIYDLCAEEKSATIKIPMYSIIVPTVPVSTEMVKVEQAVRPEIKEPLATPVPAAVTALPTKMEIHTESTTGNLAAASFLLFAVLVALMRAISSAALADKRPVAIRAIAKTITLQKHKGEFKYE